MLDSADRRPPLRGAVPMDPAQVDVVLVQPEQPGNVAAACRAMKNMGVRRLVLVQPPAGLGDAQARGLAYGAWDVLDNATTAPDLEQAVAGCTLVVGTSGRPDPDDWSPRRLAREGGQRGGHGRVALVFGPEARGLRNEELLRCHLRVRIPAHEGQPSLNLAQAVLILCYEIFLSAVAVDPVRDSPRATAGELERAVRELGKGLLDVGYLNPQNPDAVLGELRRLLARAGPTPREVALLSGIGRQVAWAGRRIAKARNGDA